VNRAIQALTVRSIDEERREIVGWASRPEVDRVGDIVDPLGARFAASVPLLVGHDHQLPVGRVSFGAPTAKGIPFTAKLPRIEEAGALKDRVDSAWQAAKYKIVDSVSIGFRVLKDGAERIETGWRYVAYEILELSLVSVPAAPGAQITATRSAAQRPAHVVKLASPAKPAHVVKLKPEDIAQGRLAAQIEESRRRRPADRGHRVYLTAESKERAERIEAARRSIEERERRWRNQ
jgi:HK97 family phage prohead protease